MHFYCCLPVRTVCDRTKQIEIGFVWFGIVQSCLFPKFSDDVGFWTKPFVNLEGHKPGVHFYCSFTHVLHKNLRLQLKRNI